MKSRFFLIDYSNIADIHATRLNKALVQVNKLMPISASVLSTLIDEKLAFLDMMTMRFSKLQDIIGSKILPLILDILGEDANTFIDKLNKLEKIGYIDDANWWMDLREIRNKMTHDYPNDYESICLHLAILNIKAAELLEFWQKLKVKITNL